MYDGRDMIDDGRREKPACHSSKHSVELRDTQNAHDVHGHTDCPDLSLPYHADLQDGEGQQPERMVGSCFLPLTLWMGDSRKS